jgi:Ca2+-binding RTX toxin-like protein
MDQVTLKKTRMKVESFEARITPAVTVGLSGATLFASSNSASDRVQVQTVDNGANLQVTFTNATGGLSTQKFAAANVNNILLIGNGGDDYLANLTGVAATISGGSGNDYLQGGTGNDVLNGNGDSDVLIDNAGGINTFDGGGGNDTLSSTVAGATMIGGGGNDLLYDIIGGTFFDAGSGTDIVIGRNDNTILGGEQVVRFGSTTAPFLVIGDVLYINGGTGDDSIVIDPGANNTVVLTFNGQKTTIPATGLRSIAVLGNAGNDTIDNNTGLFMVAYGGDGNDDIRGGDGFDFLKGGGGNDFVSARSSGNDFISGDAGADTLVSDNSFQPSGKDTLAADPTDSIQTDGADIVTGTFLANFRNA